jgi:hypothetical protein
LFDEYAKTPSAKTPLHYRGNQSSAITTSLQWGVPPPPNPATGKKLLGLAAEPIKLILLDLKE